MSRSRAEAGLVGARLPSGKGSRVVGRAGAWGWVGRWRGRVVHGDGDQPRDDSRFRSGNSDASQSPDSNLKTGEM